MARTLQDADLLRLRVMLGAMLAAFVLLAAALWRVQVASGARYQTDLVRQSVRRIRLPGLRGAILDRHGVRLADNRPSYNLAVYLEELRQPGPWSRTVEKVEQVLADISTVLGRPTEVTRADIQMHIKKRLPLPLLAWRDLDEQTLARWAEQASGRRGVDVYPEAVRVYPEGAKACHVLGYVGRAEPVQDPEEPYHFYVPEMEGRSGVEKQFDRELRGEAGGRLVRVDVSGFRHDDIGFREPKTGRDLLLTLDIRVQRVAEEALGERAGAVVILDPRNGDVLAMASRPGYDPNRFVPALSQAQWDELVNDPQTPLVNRAVAGHYTPGSIFKPVVALAALESGKASPATVFDCPGYLTLGQARFSCWYHPGHGTLRMQEAIEHSCNVYFFRLSLQCGYDYIYHMARALGLGRRTEIDLDHEEPGLLPNDAWKRRVYHDGWRDGDTVNLAIGQGPLIVTPIQMAVVTAAIANGGRVYRPRLVLGLREPGQEDFQRRPPTVVNEMHWSAESLRVVRAGLRDVVNSPTGTGRAARHPTIVVAGKTGTAEYGPKGQGRKYGWMIAFAPFEDPRYAVALVVDDAISGGVTAAPLVGQIMRELFAGDGEGAG